MGPFTPVLEPVSCCTPVINIQFPYIQTKWDILAVTQHSEPTCLSAEARINYHSTLEVLWEGGRSQNIAFRSCNYTSLATIQLSTSGLFVGQFLSDMNEPDVYRKKRIF